VNGKDFVFLYKTKLMFTFFKLNSLVFIASELILKLCKFNKELSRRIEPSFNITKNIKKTSKLPTLTGLFEGAITVLQLAVVQYCNDRYWKKIAILEVHNTVIPSSGIKNHMQTSFTSKV
jgi:hypothetical protein